VSDYANAGVRPSSDFGCYNLLSIVIFLRAQAADTPRDHCMIFRVCSGGLCIVFIHPSRMAQDLRFVNAEKCCASSLLLKTECYVQHDPAKKSFFEHKKNKSKNRFTCFQKSSPCSGIGFLKFQKVNMIFVMFAKSLSREHKMEPSFTE